MDGHTDKVQATDDAMWLKRAADSPCIDCEHYPEDLLHAAAQLSHRERLASLGALIAGVAHELSSPAGYVLSNLDMLKTYAGRLLQVVDAVADGASAEDIAALQQELHIDRVRGDLDSLMEGTREGAARIHGQAMKLRRYATPQREPAAEYDLCETIHTAVSWVGQAAGASLPVNYRMPESLPVFGHSGRVQQVLVNLLQNAADAVAGATDPRLEIVVRRDRSRVAVDVCDNGPGIGDEDPARLFEAFVTSKGEGTGLGLPISQSLAEQEGGRLTARNGTEGGAVFTLILPLSAP